MIPTLALSAIVIGLLTTGFLVISVAMILIVLIQRPQGGGLGGAFGAGGGGSSGQTAFGVRTGDALTLATIVMFVLFMLTAIGLGFAMRPSAAPSSTLPAASGTDDGQPEAPAGEGAAGDAEDTTPPAEDAGQNAAPEGDGAP